MGGGKGKSKGRIEASLPSISSRENLDEAIRECSARANEKGKSGHLIVLEFTAEWCSVCQKIKPFYFGLPKDPKIAASDRAVFLYTVNVDESTDLTNFYGASALPLFVFLVDGKKVDTLVGAQQTALKKKLLKHASSKK